MLNYQSPNHKLFSLTLLKKAVFVLFFILIFDYILFPAPALANEFAAIDQNTEEINIINPEFNYSLPSNNKINVKYSGYFNITAYSSEAAQCDDAPCITATGFNLCTHDTEDSVALNFLPFGTKIRIPELFGDKVFFVRDRMNERYTDWIDIWMKERKQAIKFGVKMAKVEILE